MIGICTIHNIDNIHSICNINSIPLGTTYPPTYPRRDAQEEEIQEHNPDGVRRLERIGA